VWCGVGGECGGSAFIVITENEERVGFCGIAEGEGVVLFLGGKNSGAEDDGSTWFCGKAVISAYTWCVGVEGEIFEDGVVSYFFDEARGGAIESVVVFSQYYG
jgi:hypothetical protein